MKILISAPANVKSPLYAKLVEKTLLLKKVGHNVYDTGIEKSSPKALAKIEKFLKETDLLIVSADVADIKTGYEIARALDEKKIVAILASDKASNVSLAQSLVGNKNVITASFTQKNLDDVLKSILKDAASKLDSKFILILPAEMERYLNWTAQNKRLHKAQIVRGAIELLMKKDKEYRSFMGE